MKKTPIIIGVVVLILILAFVGWQFLNKKSAEGGACQSINNCQTGLKCINNICSSGKAGSPCLTENDCQTVFCIKNKCSEGKSGDGCITYTDCQSGLYCIKSVCTNPPSYTKYFNKIQISKMKPMPPGPNNIPIPTTSFKNTDAIEIDVSGKADVSGVLAYELIDSTTGETILSNVGDTSLEPMSGSWGTGFIIPPGLVGNYNLNVYFNRELVYTTAIEISE